MIRWPAILTLLLLFTGCRSPGKLPWEGSPWSGVPEAGQCRACLPLGWGRVPVWRLRNQYQARYPGRKIVVDVVRPDEDEGPSPESLE